MEMEWKGEEEKVGSSLAVFKIGTLRQYQLRELFGHRSISGINNQEDSNGMKGRTWLRKVLGVEGCLGRQGGLGVKRNYYSMQTFHCFHHIIFKSQGDPMKPQFGNQSIKENRGNIKFEIARLQSIILDSVKRPTLYLSLALQVILVLQLFRAPFSYLKPLLTNPDWAYVPLLSYLVPAYYEIYLNQTGFLCVLILAIVLMLLYMLGIITLIVSSRNSRVSQIIAKIMRVKLEIYSTVLFSSIIKTVLTIYHCSSPNVSTEDQWTEFQCLYNGPDWLGWVAIGVTVPFVLIILLQSYLKYDFYAHQTHPSILKRSQQGIPIVLIFHILIEFLAITQTKLILLLVMNAVVVAIIAHQVFMDQTLNELVLKIHQGLSISLLYLLIFIDLNHFAHFPLPYLLWYFMLIMIVSTSVMIPRLNIRYQLMNINKWNSAADRLQYCSGLRMLLSLPKSTMASAMIEGYGDIHHQKCEMLTCPFRLGKEGLERIRIFRENKELEDTVIRTEELIIKIYSEGTKYFPNIPTLNIEFAIFLYQRNMKEKALNFLLSLSIDNVSLEEYYKFYRLRRALHNQLSNKGENTLDLLTEMQMRDLEEEFLRSVEKASLSDMELWSVLLEEHPDFGKLNQVGDERIKLGETVKSLYTRITEKGNSQRITSLYVEYLINVCKEIGNFHDVEEKVKKAYGLDERIMLFDWANSSKPSLIISGEEKSFGEIEDLNLSAALLLGYQKSELVNRELSFIIPPKFTGLAQDLISLKDTSSKEFYLVRKDKYMIKVTRTIYISSSILKGSIFICTLNPVPIDPYSCKLIVEIEAPFHIVCMEAKTISFFGYEVKMTDQLAPLADFSEFLHFTIRDCLVRFKDIKLEELLTPSVFRRLKPSDLESKQDFNVKIRPYLNNFLEIDIIRKKNPPLSKVSKPKVNDFRFQPYITNGEIVYVNNLTSNYEYLTEKIEVDSQYGGELIEGKYDYGKGIRIVRLQDNEVQIIEESWGESESQEKLEMDAVSGTNLGLVLENPLIKKNKNILENRESVKTFIRENSPGEPVKYILVITLIISLIFAFVVCFVFRGNHDGIVEDLQEYADQNIKIGELAVINTLVTQAALLQMNKSTTTRDNLIARFGQSLDLLAEHKNKGHVYTIDTLMLDGSPQKLTTMQYIDALNSNIQDIIMILSNDVLYSMNMMPTNFSINNAKTVYDQMTQHVLNWHYQVLSLFNQSILIESIIFSIIFLFQAGFLILISVKIYRMFNEKIDVLRLFLEISEQNVRIMSIKTQQFLNTLYNNETDIDDQETIIRKTNNKHTFAIKKKFKLIRRNKAIYVVFGVISVILIAIPTSSFAVSAQNLIFTRNTLSFLNSTSSGKSFFYRSLNSIQMNMYNNSNNPTPGYTYITFYRNMVDTYYQSFSDMKEFAAYWTSVMMENICNGTTKIEFSCSNPTSENGAMALITQLVLTTVSLTYTTDFSTYYYNYYRIFGSLHQSLTTSVLKAFTDKVETLRNLLIILLACFLVSAPFLVLMGGMRVMKVYTDDIDQTRRMLGLLPVEYLKSCESIHQYISTRVNRKGWEIV